MTKQEFAFVLACAALALALMQGVPAGSPAQDQPSAAHASGRSHREFVVAVMENDLPEARRHMSKALIATLPTAGGLTKVCANRVGPGHIQGVQTVGAVVTGDKAVVSYRLALEGGSSRFGEEHLVFEDGEWKLDVLQAAGGRT